MILCRPYFLTYIKLWHALVASERNAAIHNWFLNTNVDLLFILIAFNHVGVGPFALTSQINFEYILSSMECYLYPLPYQQSID